VESGVGELSTTSTHNIIHLSQLRNIQSYVSYVSVFNITTTKKTYIVINTIYNVEKEKKLSMRADLYSIQKWGFYI
jgi:hypothetical protein